MPRAMAMLPLYLVNLNVSMLWRPYLIKWISIATIYIYQVFEVYNTPCIYNNKNNNNDKNMAIVLYTCPTRTTIVVKVIMRKISPDYNILSYSANIHILLKIVNAQQNVQIYICRKRKKFNMWRNKKQMLPNKKILTQANIQTKRTKEVGRGLEIKRWESEKK